MDYEEELAAGVVAVAGAASTTVLVLLANATNATDSEAQVPTECDAKVSDGLLEFLIYGLLLNFISLLGIMGNAISMIVLSRPQMKSSINYLLIGLATCDTVLILLSVLMYGLPGIYAYTDYLFDYKFYVYPKIVRFLYPVSLIVQMATVYITLTVTIERYVAVCHPLKARSLCTYGRARSALAVIAFLATLYNLPKFWEVGLKSEQHWRRNVTVLCVDSTPLRRNPLYITIYVHWLYFFVYYAFPFVVLVIFNVLIYKRVRKANRDLRRLSRHQRREIGLATMLLCVVIVFLVCNVLPLVTNVYENVYTNPPAWLVQTGNLLVTFNSGINFVIYVIFGRKFKRIFLKIFCRVSLETGLDCMGRPSRADSPDFQTNEDSIATNTSNIEMRAHSLRARGLHHSSSSSHHHHHHHHPSAHRHLLHHHNSSGSLRQQPPPGAQHNGYAANSSSIIYYPNSTKPPPPQPQPQPPAPTNSRYNGHNAALQDAALC